jgi:putative ABC transport system permease protein
MTWLHDLTQDARFAVRMLRRIPGTAAIVILTLALGIGMTSAVFSVFNAVLLRPLAYPDPERLLWLSTYETDAPFRMQTVLDPDFVDWKSHAGSLEHLVAYDLSDAPVIIDGEATQERIAMVSDGFWELSGVRPSHGRVPAPGERDTLLLSYDFFEVKLGADPGAIGKAVTVDGGPVTIVGVLPRGFPLQLPWPGWPGFEPREIAAYRTVIIETASGNMLQMLNVVGKLKPGATIDQARAEIETIRARAARERPAYPGNRMALRVVPLSRELSGDARLALGVLLGSVVFVLLIACANVASLLLARASERRKEIAIRAALGATRTRLSRQLLIESLILALAGGAAGLLVADWGLSLILGLVPHAIPRLTEASIDGRVVAFAFGASLSSALVFGVAPALALGTVHLQDGLKLGATPASSIAMTPRAARLLVGIEMALAIVLLTGAGLLMKSFWQMNAHPPGFDPGRVLTMKVQFSGPQYDDDVRRRAYVDEFLRRIQSVAGVSAAGISTHGDGITVALVEGATPLPLEEAMLRSSVRVNSVSAGSARALGMRVLRGRWISDTEPRHNIVVNESLARRDFPRQDPIGRRIRLDDDQAPLATIVGVVADLKYAKLDERTDPEVYVPYSRDAPGRFTGVVRTILDPVTLAPSIRKSVSEIDRTLPVFDVRTLEQALAESIAPRRFNLFLLAVFAAAAVGLALIGIYGVIAYSVVQRTHEIGIRMALGADRRGVVTMVVRQGVRMALGGIILGVAAAILLTRVMGSLLYDVQPTDVQTFAVAAVALTLTAVMAALVPALRAARIDPAETLR